MPIKTRFIINGENHTIGRLLEFILKKNSVVTYCYYEMPHPLKEKIIIYVDLKTSDSTYDIIRHSCSLLIKLLENYLIVFFDNLKLF